MSSAQRAAAGFLAAWVVAWGVDWASAIEIGDPAPPLIIREWIKGGPIDLETGKGKHIYVIEFWATWCKPCIESIPHLTELQRRYRERGVVLVGISNEKLEEVRAFVERQGERMDYAVAVDYGHQTFRALREPFGSRLIPWACLIDRNGVIVWQGHPAELEEPLERLVKDSRIDGIAAPPAQPAGAASSKASSTASSAGGGKLREELADYLRRVRQAQTDSEAPALGARIVRQGANDAALLHDLARRILTDKKIVHRDLKLALRAAEEAYDACGRDDFTIAETLALALFENGRTRAAVEQQKRALALCETGPARSRLEQTLARYEQQAAAARAPN